MYKNKKGEVIGIVVTIVILILLVILTNTENSNLSYVENVANKLVNPLQNGITYVKNKIHGNSSFFTNINELKSENEMLKNKNNELEESLREFETIKAENRTLKEYLDLTKKYTDYKTVAADVVAFSTGGFSKSYTINKGLKDGITENCAVITPYGLVGYVVEVGRSWAKVRAITDASVSVSASIERVGNTAIVQGEMSLMEKGMCKMTYVSKEAGLEVGDYIQTSGSGGIIPAGIYIGKVKEIKNDVTGVSQEAIIKPGVDFSNIDEVLVIKD